MKSLLTKILNWLDNNFLKVGVLFLLIFIPLYPKLPLINVTHTWVYIRFEDFLILVLGIWWLFLLLRKKVSVRTPLTIPIFLYWIIGGISLIFTLLITAPHLANFFPNVAILHYIRRIEYMIVFFLAFSSVKNIADTKKIITALLIGLIGVLIYGFGQKYLGFPAFLTMNEEFAKGTPLRLGPDSRITSTFAGHYDLAAYLVIAITILTSLLIGMKETVSKTIFSSLIFLSFVLLLLTASRISLAVSLLTVAIVLVLHQKGAFLKPLLIGGLFLAIMVSGTSERLGKTLRLQTIVIDAQTGRPIASIISPQETTTVGQDIEENLPEGTYFIALPTSRKNPAIATSSAVIKKGLPEGVKTTEGKSYEQVTLNGSFLIQKALVFDISFTTRFQGEWPRAIEAFKRNPFVGSGYSSISLATDNDYLRSLGETGILGFISFFSIFLVYLIFIRKALPQISDMSEKAFVIGVTTALVGLLINAFLIDIFEASKVAYITWILIGFSVGITHRYVKPNFNLFEELKRLLPSKISLFSFFAILGFTVFFKSLGNYFTGDDFTWLKWASTTTIEDIPQYFTNAVGFFYRPIEKLFFLLGYSVFWLNPPGFRFIIFATHLITTWIVYLLALKLTNNEAPQPDGRGIFSPLLRRERNPTEAPNEAKRSGAKGDKLTAWVAGLIFLLLPIHHETVFWLSSSGGLFAGLFIFISVYTYLIHIQTRKKRDLVFSLLAFIMALLSHEGAVILPLIVIYLEIFVSHPKMILWQGIIHKTALYFLILILYLAVRKYSDALTFFGDYSYNLVRLPFNFIGNYLGYTGLTIFGERFIPIYDLLRQRLARDVFLAIVSLGFFLLLGVVLYRLRARLTSFLSRETGRLLMFVISFSFIALLPYLGLGNIAERYGYIASFAYALLVGRVIYLMYKFIVDKSQKLAITVVTIAISLLSLFYASELYRMSQDWQKAGKIAQNILTSIKKTHPTLQKESSFYFVNLPIRQNRAWIFPVGLKDGIWFNYRDNQSVKINVTNIISLGEAVNLKNQNTNANVFIFKDDKLEEVRTPRP